MEIHLNGRNQTATNIDLRHKDFTFYEAEEEVLLMPFFTFQVTDTHTSSSVKDIELPKGEKFKGKVTTITLVELPYMDLLVPR